LEILRKDKKEMLQIINTVSGVKNALISSKLDMARERISELDMTIKLKNKD
jgi:hypothetical protein